MDLNIGDIIRLNLIHAEATNGDLRVGMDLG